MTGVAIKNFLESNGISVAELAGKMGKSRQSLYLLLKREDHLRSEQFANITKALTKMNKEKGDKLMEIERSFTQSQNVNISGISKDHFEEILKEYKEIIREKNEEIKYLREELKDSKKS